MTRSITELLKHGVAAALLVALSTTTFAVSAGSKINYINLVEETDRSATFDVGYTYDGRYGKSVFMNVVMSNDGKKSRLYGVKPGRVSRGTGRTRVVLGIRSDHRKEFWTNQVRATMYQGGKGSITSRDFSFRKSWQRSARSLKPVLARLKVFKPELKPTPQPSSPAALTPDAATTRTIDENGAVVIVYADGTKKTMTGSGTHTVNPDGSEMRTLHSTAQPSTPPTAPPDDAHRQWLEGENARLLGIIQTLVGFDEPSVEAYLTREKSLDDSPYTQISSRTGVIDLLISP